MRGDIRMDWIPTYAGMTKDARNSNLDAEMTEERSEWQCAAGTTAEDCTSRDKMNALDAALSPTAVLGLATVA